VGLVARGYVWLSPIKMLMCKSSLHQVLGTNLLAITRWRKFLLSVQAVVVGLDAKGLTVLLDVVVEVEVEVLLLALRFLFQCSAVLKL
jgi:hypothetical protein